MSRRDLERINFLKSEIKRLIEQVIILKRQDQDIKPTVRQIWELSKEKFILETKANKSLKVYEGIIFTVGTTPQPLILNILANKPKAVYFIYTDLSESFINIIMEETKLNETQTQKGRMPNNSIIALFRLIKRGLYFLNEEKGIALEKIAIDPTGGTKVMSAGCGLATSILDLDILYVGNEKYNTALRRPEPGSEILENFPNPKKILMNDKLIEDMEVSRSKVLQISQYFKDITNTHIIYLALKTGILLSQISYIESHELDENVFAGFVSGLSEFTKEVAKNLGKSQSSISHNKPNSMDCYGFKMTIFNGEYIRLIVISNESVGNLMGEKLYKFLDEYENFHIDDLRVFTGVIDNFSDFPEKMKEMLAIDLNEKCILNKNKIYQYQKNPTIIYVLNDWYEKIRATSALTSFYPVTIPNVLMRELGIDEKEARYWTYDLFKEKMIIPIEE
ncbi:MAG: hypothetical protein BAJALOKI1v1_1160005 [Promethearchaeota archaeon]|nr:MAG: hypothetical protein BAJALOKI1v1_1160005 [Candidatus Lokiarchaeota archaeon]